MKKHEGVVVPQEGQAWLHTLSTVADRIIFADIHRIEWDDSSTTNMLSGWRDNFKFAPSNTLEWLAVNVTEWTEGEYVVRDVNSEKGYYFTYLREVGRSSYKEWLDCCISLGLIEKEVNLFNLVESKVNEVYLSAGGTKYDLMMIGTDSNIYVFKGPSGSLRVTNRKGVSNIISSDFRIVSKVDPRWWLKSFPDTKMFSSGVSSFECSKEGQWLVVDHNGDKGWLCLELPKLLGSEILLSSITLKELGVWQEANKGKIK